MVKDLETKRLQVEEEKSNRVVITRAGRSCRASDRNGTWGAGCRNRTSGKGSALFAASDF